ncbi:hypothetical protein R1sor_026981 [Riccia sorocarpa]|uniref:Malectin-like domain-containing protein n=1 Tax=Riccia sorocarpa TaxID=122646 RepID=A0ABD3GDM7_9MARC
MKLQNTVTDYCIFLIRIVVLSSLYRTGVCKGLPVEPFGYISLDCGGGGGYNDPVTELAWVADEDYLESYDWLKSENLTFSSKVMMSNPRLNNPKQVETARIFEFSSTWGNGLSKYCYTFDLSRSNNKSRSYLVRAMFPPRDSPWNAGLTDTDITYYYLAVDTALVKVLLDDHDPVTIELLAPALGDSMDICVIPFSWGDDRLAHATLAISSLEIRSIPEILYPLFQEKIDPSGRALSRKLNYYLTLSRLNFGGKESSPALRYPLDRYDRLWYAPSSASDPLKRQRGCP